jgi:RimJ/RimL family protein N-acetyltransferase
MSNNHLQIIPVNIEPETYYALTSFFESISDNEFFQPHSFASEYAIKLCNYKGEDLYYILEKENVIVYGFLRGWDNHWDDICLGIIVEPSEQGKGYGELMMHFLHAAAKQRGLDRIRVHVHPNNHIARALYSKMGYVFNGKRHNEELVGYKNLERKER